MLHVYGDSHSWGFRALPDVEIHHTGTHTMFRMGRDGIPFSHPEGEPCIVCYGEIDVRCHLWRIADRDNRRISSVIRDTVAYYCAAARTLRNITVASIVPPSELGNSEVLPFYGSIEQRIVAHRLANAFLRRECLRLNLPFFDYAHRFTDSKGALDYWQSDGNVHIADKHYWKVREEWDAFVGDRGPWGAD